MDTFFLLVKQWLKRYYFIFIALLIVSLSFIILLQLNPQSFLSTDQEVKINFADNISRAHLRLVDLFNQRYQGRIQVVPVDLPFEKFSTNERKELLTRTLRSKSTRLDVFAVDQIWISRFAKWAEPLDPFLPREERDALLSYALSSCIDNGRLVGVPLYIDIGVLYYRHDLLRSFPDADSIEAQLQRSITWDALIALHNRWPHKKEKPFYLFPAEAYEGLMCSFIENLASQDTALYRTPTASLVTPQAVQALQLMVDLIRNHKATPEAVLGFKEVDVYPYALARDALFFRGWPGNLNKYAETDAEKIALIRMAALPHFSGGQPKAVYGGWNLMVARNSTRKKEALTFIHFLLTEEAQKVMYETMGFLPANNSVYMDSLFCARHPGLRYLRHLLDHGAHRPASEYYTQISDIITYELHRALKGEVTARQALQAAEQRIHREVHL